MLLFLFCRRRPPRPPPFPYTTLFRSSWGPRYPLPPSVRSRLLVASCVCLLAAPVAASGVLVACSMGEEARPRSEEHTSELQSQSNLVCRLLLEKKKQITPSQQINRTS